MGAQQRSGSVTARWACHPGTCQGVRQYMTQAGRLPTQLCRWQRRPAALPTSSGPRILLPCLLQSANGISAFEDALRDEAAGSALAGSAAQRRAVAVAAAAAALLQALLCVGGATLPIQDRAQVRA
jgi:hypothetical protein